jgi:hypothetical protein
VQQRKPFVKRLISAAVIKTISPDGADNFNAPGFARPFPKG